MQPKPFEFFCVHRSKNLPMPERQWIVCMLGLGGLAIAAAVMLAEGEGELGDRHLVNAAELERWIGQLGANEQSRRDDAARQLTRFGEAALPALDEAARRHPDVEVRLKARWLFEKLLLESRSTQMPLVLIPPGKFPMGSQATEAGRAADESVHEVTLTKAFLLGANEVTQHEYETVMATNPSWFSQSSVGKSRLGTEASDDLPVERVSWFDALAFCNRLSDLDGFPPFYSLTQIALSDGSIRSAQVTVLGGSGYRLPTEAEWEYACRAGTQTPFYFGVSNTGREANVKPTLVSGGYGTVSPKFAEISRTVRVGSYPSNEWQLSDMHGNAAEWCWDRYDKDHDPEIPQTDPQGAAQGPHRVVRGGSWMVHEMQCRSASRFYMTPDERKDFVGFRVARTPKLPEPQNRAGD